MLPRLEGLGVRKEVGDELCDVFAWLSAQEAAVKDEFERAMDLTGAGKSSRQPLDSAEMREKTWSREADTRDNLHLFARVASAAMIFRHDRLCLGALQAGTDRESYEAFERAVKNCAFPEDTCRARLLGNILNHDSYSTAEAELVVGMLADYVSRQMPMGLWQRLSEALNRFRKQIPDNVRAAFGENLDMHEYAFIGNLAEAAASHLRVEDEARLAEEQRRETAAEKQKTLEIKTEKARKAALEAEKNAADAQKALIEVKQRLLDSATAYIEMSKGEVPAALKVGDIDGLVKEIDFSHLASFSPAEVETKGRSVIFKTVSIPRWRQEEMKQRDAAMECLKPSEHSHAQRKWKNRVTSIENGGIKVVIPQQLAFQILKELPRDHPIRKRCKSDADACKITIGADDLRVYDDGWDSVKLSFQRRSLRDSCKVEFHDLGFGPADRNDIELVACLMILQAIELFGGKPVPRVP